MKIDKEHALKAFKDYTANYDANNAGVNLKVAHTYRVASLAERIESSIETPGKYIGLAWLLGLLHDIGRFEQVTRYGTFKDALSVDHAELGADILFKDNLFEAFVDGVDGGEASLNFRVRAIAETAIRFHNKLTLPNGLDEDTELYSKILRDADKIDIFRVLTEPPYNERDLTGLSVRSEVMQCVMEHRCVPRPNGASQFNYLEAFIAQCCMAFELEYNISRDIAAHEGFLKKLLDKNHKAFAVVKDEIAKAWVRDF